MHDKHILNVDEAAQLVHATSDTLLRYIRRGDLPAARLGKQIVILYTDLIALVEAIAARQTAARLKRAAPSGRDGLDATRQRHRPAVQVFVIDSDSPTAPRKPRGRRKPPPPLPRESA